jgi:hypothetical protein
MTPAFSTLGVVYSAALLSLQVAGLTRAALLGWIGYGSVGWWLFQIYSWIYFGVSVIWVYRLHQDLAALYGSYPITPRQALARNFIPVYGIWGVWSVYTTISKSLQQNGVVLTGHANQLRLWANLSVPISAIGLTLACALFAMNLGNPALPIATQLGMLSSALGILGSICWLQMIGIRAQQSTSRLRLRHESVRSHIVSCETTVWNAFRLRILRAL